MMRLLQLQCFGIPVKQLYTRMMTVQTVLAQVAQCKVTEVLRD